MNQKAIAVLFGGVSSEYEVSLQSAYAVITHANLQKFRLYPIGITKQGAWMLYTGCFENILNDSWWQDIPHCTPVLFSPDAQTHGFFLRTPQGFTPVRVDAVFPILHGRFGEDGTVQGLMELANIPIIGCGTCASALCMDKLRAHQLVASQGICTPKTLALQAPLDAEQIARFACSVGYPLFVKPLRAGSSFGVTRVEDPALLPDAIGLAFEYDSTVLLEEAIPGFEVGCAIIGNRQLLAGRVDEIELQGGFFDFTQKYTLSQAKIHMPARIPAPDERRIQQTAKRIYRILGCQGFARVDLFFTPSGGMVFNEVNTIPGFTPHSRFPNMMQGAGLSFAQLVDRLMDMQTA